MHAMRKAVSVALASLVFAMAGVASARPLSVGDLVYTDGESIIYVDPVTGVREIIASPGNVNTVAAEPGGTVLANVGGILKRFYTSGMMKTILGTEDSPDIVDLARGKDGSIVYTDGDGVFLVDEVTGTSMMLRQPGDTRTVAISMSGIVYYNFKQYIRGVDPLTGASVGIKDGAGFRNVRDMTVGPMGMVFYTDGYSIFKVHPKTGKRVILLTPNDMNSVAFGGEKLAYNRDPYLREANAATWAKNAIPGGEGLNRVRDLSVVPVPEPSTALLLAIGIALLIAARRNLSWLQPEPTPEAARS